MTDASVCVLTSQARGAVAVLVVWGADAIDVADRAFRPARGARLIETAENAPRFGRIGVGTGDEVVAVVVSTGPTPEVEIHCHGGPAAVALVIAGLLAEGAREDSAEAWLRHHNGSSIKTEALIELARAATLRPAEILLEQAEGALGRDLGEVERLIASDQTAACRAIGRLLDRARVGLRLVSGWSVALAGRPNVGKSRLFNALAGFERAIVDPTPGTTRDVVTLRTAIGGWPVEIADTAGLRETTDAIEAGGIALARSRQDRADLTLLVLDRSEPLTASDRDLIGRLNRPLIVAAKADLPAAWLPEDDSTITVSAETGEGLDVLLRAISETLIPEVPAEGAGVPFRERHVVGLNAALAALERGRSSEALRVLRLI